MRKGIILRYGEIFLKGKNQRWFENILIKNLQNALADYAHTFKKIQGRYVIENYDLNKENDIIQALSCVFGLTSLSPVSIVPATQEEILSLLSEVVIENKSFKVKTTRADKNFPIKSSEFSKIAGGVILDCNKLATVDVINPDVLIEIDIREGGFAYICQNRIPCIGGMPVGCAGEGLALLSGGLDSPVACYLINKRGMHNTYLHFYSYPFTSLQAKEKVILLGKMLKKYNGESKIIFVPFTHVQQEIHKNCDNDYMITLMRRIMFSIASKLCEKFGQKAIISGECLGQVASQTIESLTSSNQCAGIVPVLRPLIAFDKEETIEISRKIGTYDTSILPYEDCCTVFLPKTPVIKPNLKKVEIQEARLDVPKLIEECINNIEIMDL